MRLAAGSVETDPKGSGTPGEYMETSPGDTPMHSPMSRRTSKSNISISEVRLIEMIVTDVTGSMYDTTDGH